MIVIVGESGSGKTTLANNFIKAHPEYRKIVTYTTRPKRSGEIDGIDYHFISADQFKRLVEENFFIEYTTYRDWYYGTAKTDCEDDYTVAVLNPPGLRKFKRLGVNCTSVYLNVDRRSRLIQMLNRGDEIEEAYRRNITDVGQFSGVESEVDFVIENHSYKNSEETTLAKLEECLKIRRVMNDG